MEEIASKAKEAVTANDHAQEPPKTDVANGNETHPEASEAPAAEPTVESIPKDADKAELAESAKVETPVPEGESSVVELQTPNFQGEAVR